MADMKKATIVNDFPEIPAVVLTVAAFLWAKATGDVFLPSVIGAAFSVTLRARSGANVDRSDLLISAVVSVAVGLIAGPYLADQMPDGEGVRAVGALIASTIGVGFLSSLHSVEWDLSEWAKRVSDVFRK